MARFDRFEDIDSWKQARELSRKIDKLSSRKKDSEIVKLISGLMKHLKIKDRAA